ncbi:MAG: aminotransferase class III-fold pyridoxal phosphate-dependent enzyme [Oscillospiraceae bacterium]|nr:aminotransferase class III-fold pyridoxal phosphate-dependent enzyme [Oscillospiraceae bacterium]
MTITEKTNKHIMQSYGRFSLEIENSKGLIDFGSGIGTNSLGFCDEQWANAVCEQARTLQHTSNLYYTKPAADFAEKLCAVTGYTNAFLCNSGAEANECAIKLARKYSFDKYGAGRNKIVTLNGSFHGRTMTTLSATGQDIMHPDCFAPYMPGFAHIEPNAPIGSFADDVCAVMLEYVQGEGGVISLEQSFVDEVFALCAENDILVIADEVQTGAGRTGAFLAGTHFGKAADITTMAKGLFGGLPGGACLANEKCAGVLTAGMHGSTYGGNPVVMAGGSVVVARVSDAAFLAEVVAKGDYIREFLAKLPQVEAISGRGLMLGLTLKSAKEASSACPAEVALATGVGRTAIEVAKACLEKGLLVLTAKDKLRLLPPLTITYDELDEGLSVLKEILL